MSQLRHIYAIKIVMNARKTSKVNAVFLLVMEKSKLEETLRKRHRYVDVKTWHFYATMTPPLHVKKKYP